MNKKEDSCFIEGERIYLRALTELDVEGSYPSWLNNQQVCIGTSHGIKPYTVSNALEYIKFANTTDTALILAIVLKENNSHIGNIALQRINWIYRTAEFAILLGDQLKWYKGFGLEASNLIITHGFYALNLNRIECGTFEHNKGMIKLAHSLGMKQEGRREKAAYKNGKFIDIIEFGLLKEEFEKNIQAQN